MWIAQQSNSFEKKIKEKKKHIFDLHATPMYLHQFFKTELYLNSYLQFQYDPAWEEFQGHRKY